MGIEVDRVVDRAGGDAGGADGEHVDKAGAERFVDAGALRENGQLKVEAVFNVPALLVDVPQREAELLVEAGNADGNGLAGGRGGFGAVVGVGGGVAVAAGISGGLLRRGVLCRLRGAGAEGQKHGNHKEQCDMFFHLVILPFLICFEQCFRPVTVHKLYLA